MKFVKMMASHGTEEEKLNDHSQQHVDEGKWHFKHHASDDPTDSHRSRMPYYLEASQLRGS